jgi:hypothetical protein
MTPPEILGVIFITAFRQGVEDGRLEIRFFAQQRKRREHDLTTFSARKFNHDDGFITHRTYHSKKKKKKREKKNFITACLISTSDNASRDNSEN